MKRKINDMSWPAPSVKMYDLEWRLRYLDRVERSDLVSAAAIVSAYRELISLPQKRRQEIIRELRKGPYI